MRFRRVIGRRNTYSFVYNQKRGHALWIGFRVRILWIIFGTLYYTKNYGK